MVSRDHSLDVGSNAPRIEPNSGGPKPGHFQDESTGRQWQVSIRVAAGNDPLQSKTPFSEFQRRPDEPRAELRPSPKKSRVSEGLKTGATLLGLSLTGAGIGTAVGFALGGPVGALVGAGVGGIFVMFVGGTTQIRRVRTAPKVDERAIMLKDEAISFLDREGALDSAAKSALRFVRPETWSRLLGKIPRQKMVANRDFDPGTRRNIACGTILRYLEGALPPPGLRPQRYTVEFNLNNALAEAEISRDRYIGMTRGRDTLPLVGEISGRLRTHKQFAHERLVATQRPTTIEQEDWQDLMAPPWPRSSETKKLQWQISADICRNVARTAVRDGVEAGQNEKAFLSGLAGKVYGAFERIEPQRELRRFIKLADELSEGRANPEFGGADPSSRNGPTTKMVQSWDHEVMKKLATVPRDSALRSAGGSSKRHKSIAVMFRKRAQKDDPAAATLWLDNLLERYRGRDADLTKLDQELRRRIAV
jgi:hypothetical protein